MNALNFLYQKPLENWIDYFVNPSLLETHLKKPEPDPKVGEILSEFIERAKTEDKECVSNKQGLDDEELAKRKEKAGRIWLFAIGIGTHLEWDMNIIKKTMGLSVLQEFMDKFLMLICADCLNQQQPSTIAQASGMEGTTGEAGSEASTLLSPAKLLKAFTGAENDMMSSLNGLQLHAIITYCHWLIEASVYVRFLRAPMKENAVALMQAMEASKVMFLSQELMSLSDNAATILKNWLASKRDDLSSFTPMQFFNHEEEYGELLKLTPSSLDSARITGLKARIQYSMLEYSFALQRMTEAKEHLSAVLDIQQVGGVLSPLYFSLGFFASVLFRDLTRSIIKSNAALTSAHHQLNRDCIYGYCGALGLDPTDLAKPARVSPPSSPPSVSRRIADAKLTGNPDNVSQVIRNTKEKMPLTVLSEVNGYLAGKSRNTSTVETIEISQMIRRHGYTGRRMSQVLLNPTNWKLFCEIMNEELNEVRVASDAGIFAVYLKFLSHLYPGQIGELMKDTKNAPIPALSAYFQQSKTSNLSTSGSSSNLPRKYGHPKIDVYDFLNFGGDDFWRMVCSTDYAEIRKSLMENIGQLRAPSRYSIPETMEEVFNLIGGGPVHDFIAFVSCKSLQLCRVGRIAEASHLLNSCTTEPGPLSTPNVKGAFEYEILRQELIKYHDMVYRSTDLTLINSWRMDLSPKVKTFAIMICSLPPNSMSRMEHFDTLFLLSTTFLLNMNEFQFIMDKCKNFQSRYMDVAKMLSAFCRYEKDSERLSVVDAFFQILLKTMMDTKVAAGTASSMLISRQQFRGLLINIKEQISISLLLSFFATLFNSLQRTATLFIEHESLMPAKPLSNINETFLEEVLGITLKNALLTNPTNAFSHRIMADFKLAMKEPKEAMKHYLQALQVSSSGFTTPVPENVGNRQLYENMMKCCGLLGARTEEAMMAPLIGTPEAYAKADVALQNSAPTYDPSDALYPLIWDPMLAEILVANLEKQESVLKEEIAIGAMSVQELNGNNQPAILDAAVQRRKNRFFTSLCDHYY